jgi:hypothetical protein
LNTASSSTPLPTLVKPSAVEPKQTKPDSPKDEPKEIDDTPAEQEPPPSPSEPPTPSDDPPPEDSETMADNKKQRKIKLNNPPIFDGDRSKTLAFLLAVTTHFTVNPDEYPNDKVKKLFALSWMTEGTAIPWAQKELERILDLEEETTANISVAPTGGAEAETWTAFANRFKKYFSDVVTKQIAQNKLQTLKQGTRRVDDYVAEFQATAIQSGLAEEASLILLFKNGLNRPIREKMTGLLDQPTELIKWFEYSTRFDNQWFADQELYKHRGGGFIKDQRKPEEQKTATVNAMSQEERDRHFQQRLCFRCHQTGHLSRDCPSKPKQGRGRPFTKPRTIREIDVQETPTPTKEEEEHRTTKIRAMIKNLNFDDKADVMDYLQEADEEEDRTIEVRAMIQKLSNDDKADIMDYFQEEDFPEGQL